MSRNVTHKLSMGVKCSCLRYSEMLLGKGSITVYDELCTGDF